jgi:hypothetical protein
MQSYRLRILFIIGILVAGCLIQFGKILVPGENYNGVFAALLILIIYGYIFWICLPKIDKLNSYILPTVIVAGLLAGLVFTGEIILEYTLLPKDNTLFGLIEFGSVFLTYLISSLYIFLKTKNFGLGVITAIMTSMISNIIWIIVFLTTYYIFYKSPLMNLIYQAEGEYVDFARSGAKNFPVFIMEDYTGAVFYHSLLGPLIALIFGAIGGLIGKIYLNIKSRFYFP